MEKAKRGRPVPNLRWHEGEHDIEDCAEDEKHFSDPDRYGYKSKRHVPSSLKSEDNMEKGDDDIGDFSNEG